jgi:hypothetical protein
MMRGIVETIGVGCAVFIVSGSRTLGFPLANYNPLPGPPKIRSLNPALKMVE